jgi:DNA-binding NtrC family response regulator
VILLGDIPREVLKASRIDKNMEKDMIIETLKKNEGNSTKAIEDLPFGRTKYYELLKKYGIDPKGYKPTK